jgi:hypothetical protein
MEKANDSFRKTMLSQASVKKRLVDVFLERNLFFLRGQSSHRYIKFLCAHKMKKQLKQWPMPHLYMVCVGACKGVLLRNKTNQPYSCCWLFWNGKNAYISVFQYLRTGTLSLLKLFLHFFFSGSFSMQQYFTIVGRGYYSISCYYSHRGGFISLGRSWLSRRIS